MPVFGLSLSSKPFALSLSKGFDKLSLNGWGYITKPNHETEPQSRTTKPNHEAQLQARITRVNANAQPRLQRS
jgi:hypothetical protein